MSGFVRTSEIDVDAPAERVYSYVVDVTRHAEWADQQMTVEHVAGPAAGVGATYKTHVEIDMPVGHSKDDAEVVVVEAVEPKRVQYESRDGSGHHRWTVDLTETASRTHVTQTVERIDAPAWFKVVQPAVWKVMGHKMVDNGLVNLKRRAEAAAAS